MRLERGGELLNAVFVDPRKPHVSLKIIAGETGFSVQTLLTKQEARDLATMLEYYAQEVDDGGVH